MSQNFRSACLAAILIAATIPTAAQPPLPSELEPFVRDGMESILFDSADLNLDKFDDYVLVLEPIVDEEDRAEPDFDPFEARRLLLVIVRDANGKLAIASQSDRAVFCAECGGMMGDPLQGVDAERGKITIAHYGGSAWRWSNEFTFGYSRRDKAWQLIRVEESSFHASDPENEEHNVFTPPKDFGKIDLRDFDPDNWKGTGPK